MARRRWLDRWRAPPRHPRRPECVWDPRVDGERSGMVEAEVGAGQTRLGPGHGAHPSRLPAVVRRDRHLPHAGGHAQAPDPRDVDPPGPDDRPRRARARVRPLESAALQASREERSSLADASCADVVARDRVPVRARGEETAYLPRRILRRRLRGVPGAAEPAYRPGDPDQLPGAHAAAQSGLHDRGSGHPTRPRSAGALLRWVEAVDYNQHARAVSPL